MSDTEFANEQKPVWPGLLVGACLLIGLILRLDGMQKESLWYDELYSATQASVALSDVYESIRLYDVHPPVYYLQLSLWEKIHSGDVWLRLNSTAWWILSAISLYFVAKKLTSPGVALLALALYSVNPPGIHFGRELRMYAMLIFLAIWSFYFTERFLTSTLKSDRWRYGLLTLATSVIVIYSHGAGFLILVSMWCQACLMWGTGQTSFQSGFRFMLLQGFALLAGIPEHARAAALQANHGGLSYAIAPSFGELVEQSSWLFAGLGQPFGLWTPAITLGLITAPVLTSCIIKGAVQRAVLCFVLVPILAVYTISHLSGPIWVFRAISYAIPFTCLGLATGVLQISHILLHHRENWQWKRRMTTGIYVALLVSFFATAIQTQREMLPRTSHFQSAVDYLHSESSAGDLIVVPQKFCYWAFCWYFVGPGAVDPLHDDETLHASTGQIISVDSPLEHTNRSLRQVSSGRTVWIITRGEHPTHEIIEELETDASVELRMVQRYDKIWIWRLQPIPIDTLAVAP